MKRRLEDQRSQKTRKPNSKGSTVVVAAAAAADVADVVVAAAAAADVADVADVAAADGAAAAVRVRVDSGRSSEKRSILNRDGRISIWEGGSKGIHRPSVTSSPSGSRSGSGSLGGRRLDSVDEGREGEREEGEEDWVMGLNPGYI